MKERLNQIKRVMAAGIDMHIVFLMNIVVYGLAVTVWRIGRDYFYDYIGSYSIGWTVLLYTVSYTASMFLYYAFLEMVLRKKSVGKYIVRYGSPIYAEVGSREEIILHIWFRVISCFLYPVTILYFLFTGRMIYDTLLSKGWILSIRTS